MEKASEKVQLNLELEPAVDTLRKNLPLAELSSDAYTLELQSAVYLVQVGVWERVTQNAFNFAQKSEDLNKKLQKGIHDNTSKIWKSLPVEKR